jgi:hypothetical protein
MKNGIDVFNDVWKKDVLPMICGERDATLGHPVNLRAVFSFVFWEGRNSMLAELDDDLKNVVKSIPPKPEPVATNGSCFHCGMPVPGSVPGRMVTCKSCGQIGCCRA